jgi:hypothetical protein
MPLRHATPDVASRATPFLHFRRRLYAFTHHDAFSSPLPAVAALTPMTVVIRHFHDAAAEDIMLVFDIGERAFVRLTMPLLLPFSRRFFPRAAARLPTHATRDHAATRTPKPIQSRSVFAYSHIATIPDISRHRH